MSTSTVADIFNAGFDDYVKTNTKLPYNYYKSAHAISSCRTEELGGHVYQCEECEHEKILYNSCCNRHCPQCQSKARMLWVQARINELLPVSYFHTVFTIPSELNPFVLRNQRSFYKIMFRAVKETLIELAKDKKHLGAEVGFILILHTWGQNLIDHPHIHCLIPGGGISKNGSKWKHCKKDFLFPVRVMTKLFRGKVMDYFRKAVIKGEIKFHGTLTRFEDHKLFKLLLNNLYQKQWVIYVKKPFASPEAVLKYLGNYTHRIAISNHRILSVRNNKVTFSWKDYSDNNKRKTMTVTIQEFIRRFLLHILPDRFMRIRHYGFLGNRSKKEKLKLCRKLLKQRIDDFEKTKDKKEWYEIVEELTGNDPRICCACRKGILIQVSEIPKLKVRGPD